MRKLMFPVAFFLVAATLPAMAPRQGTELRWFKRNTHTHTIESDGDSTPEVVATWYRHH